MMYIAALFYKLIEAGTIVLAAGNPELAVIIVKSLHIHIPKQLFA